MKKVMSKKKEITKKSAKVNGEAAAVQADISSEADLKTFLLNIRDKMVEQTAAPVYAVAAINQLLTTPELYKYLNEENKELSRDIWLRIKQSGFHSANPPMLFGKE